MFSFRLAICKDAIDSSLKKTVSFAPTRFLTCAASLTVPAWSERECVFGYPLFVTWFSIVMQSKADILPVCLNNHFSSFFTFSLKNK